MAKSSGKSEGCGCPAKGDVAIPQQAMSVMTSNPQTKPSKQGKK